MSASNHGFSADPDGINQDGRRIYEAADYADEMINDAFYAREPHGVPWGEKGDYSKQMQETLGVAESVLWELLPLVSLGLTQAADGTLQSSGNIVNMEHRNVDTTGSFDTRLPGSRR